MTIQEIEQAVRKQLPFKKEQHLFLRTNGEKDYLADAGMIIICGLASVYISKPQEKIISHYDVTQKSYQKYVKLFTANIERVSEIMSSYGVNLGSKTLYKDFKEAFWMKHNIISPGDIYKTGIRLSDVLSGRKEYRKFLKEHESCFRDNDFTAFFIYNKAQLTKNILGLKKTNINYVDLLYFGF